MQSQVKPRKQKTIFSKLWLVSQKGCILKLQLSDLKQLWPSQNVMSFLGEVIETKANYTQTNVSSCLCFKQVPTIETLYMSQLNSCHGLACIHTHHPYVMSRSASKYGTWKITDRLRSRTGMWNLWCKKTSQWWSGLKRKKRTEIHGMYPKKKSSGKTKLDHLYPSICYECLNDFVTLDGSLAHRVSWVLTIRGWGLSRSPPRP